MSYKIEVKVYGDDEFYPNGIRLATEEEAKAYGSNKVGTWSLAEKYRVAESADPVNYRWELGVGLVSVEKAA